MADDSTQTDLGFAVIDDEREQRTGVPEVVYGQGKTPDQIVSIVEHLLGTDQSALVTRVDPERAERIVQRLPMATYEPLPRLLWCTAKGHEAFATKVPGTVAVISGGTSDLPVAEEAARTCEWFGVRAWRGFDIGVAGLHRLTSRLDQIREADVVIAVAGMEGALPSVVAGLVKAPVIGVPTSIGYGTNLEGITPLLAMMTSCAGGIGVVNIDNGFGAAQLALRMLGVAPGEPR